jgi:hypothetical protein
MILEALFQLQNLRCTETVLDIIGDQKNFVSHHTHSQMTAEATSTPTVNFGSIGFD